MMTPDAHTTPVRVSIIERLVPSLAFIVAALGGAVGTGMLIRFFTILRQSENAGYASVFGGLAEIELVVGVILVFAAVLGAIGIIVSVIRLFTTNTTASPPGILLLIVGLLSLMPPYALNYVLRLIKGVVSSPDPPEGGVSTIADTFMTFAPFLIIGAGMVVVVLLAFSFIPFSSRPGRKVLPLVSLILVEILIAVLIGVYFWGAKVSITERDRDREAPLSAESESDTPDANSFERYVNSYANEANVTSDTSSNSHSNSRSKTISIGVLNGKAISLPQPAYPPAARAVKATGSVSVQVLVDEKGEVISAVALSGHPLLRASAVQAARQARFAPAKLSGQTVRMAGVLTFNFSGQR